MNWNFKKILNVLAAVFSGMGEVCTTGQRLPRVVNQPKNIRLSGLWSGNIEQGFNSRNHYSIINVVEGGGVHFTRFFNQSTLSLLDFTAMQSQHFLLNSWYANVRKGVKNPLLYGISCHKGNRIYTLIGRKAIGQFPNQLTGSYNLRGKPHGVREDVLNDNINRTATKRHNLFVNRAGRLIKTIPNSPIG